MAGPTQETNDKAGGQETRQAILCAARQRFLHYGFKKTTIDEIAADAGVGKGTVYLYFDSKEDILLTIAQDVKKSVTEEMRAIAASPLTAPEEKLWRMVRARILAVYDACHASAHGVELVDDMMRPPIMACGKVEHEAQRTLLARVLSEGAKRGDFDVPNGDFARAADHLQMAFVSYFPPYARPCHGELSCRASLEKDAGELFEFLMCGLRRRA